MPEEHAEQVARLAVLTAEHLGLPARAVQRCRLAGWLHDVGKLAISEQILTKPGPLDDAEWALMRTHPAVGAAVVSRVAALRQAAPAVRHHHERYSGGGYPDDLAGTAIPLEARIIAAADAYAAMTATRPYSAREDARGGRGRAPPERRLALRPRGGRIAARGARPGRPGRARRRLKGPLPGIRTARVTRSRRFRREPRPLAAFEITGASRNRPEDGAGDQVSHLPPLRF